MKAIGEARTEAGQVVQGTFVPLRDVARQVNVHYSTILNWIRKGKVKAVGYKNQRGHWVFKEEDIQRFKDFLRSVHPAT